MTVDESDGVLKTSHPSAIAAFEAEQRNARQFLIEERVRAVKLRDRSVTWLVTVGFGPAALAAVLLAILVEGSEGLAIGLASLGAAVTAWRAWRAHRHVREIDRELEDPMDGSSPASSPRA